MNMDERLRMKLRTEMSDREDDLAMQKKRFNIKAFSELSRSGMLHGKRERKLLLWTTPYEERICIQYPGKESVRYGGDKRPWDFRPKLDLRDGRQYKDLSFEDVWREMERLRNRDPEVLHLVATMLFRLSMLTDHRLVQEWCEYADIERHTGNVVGRGRLKFEYYKYSPDTEILDYFNERIGEMDGVSFEAYMLLTDLIAQNEDCKYYYRDEIQYNRTWEGEIGRSNNLMTHINVIAVLGGKVVPTEETDRLRGRRNVAPISKDKLPKVSEGLIYKGTINFDR